MDRAQAEQIALSQLDGGERLLWSGSPEPGLAMIKALPMSLIGIPFTMFAAFWMWSASDMMHGTARTVGPWSFFPFLGVPFLLIGLAVLTGPIWVYFGARGTVYAVTDKRALIISGGSMRGVQSFTHETMTDITRMERPDGSGSVYFAMRTSMTSKGFMQSVRIGFEGIPEVRHVEQLIRDNLAQPKAA